MSHLQHQATEKESDCHVSLMFHWGLKQVKLPIITGVALLIKKTYDNCQYSYMYVHIQAYSEESCAHLFNEHIQLKQIKIKKAPFITFEIKMHNTLLNYWTLYMYPHIVIVFLLLNTKRDKNTQALKLGTCISWYFLDNQLHSTDVWIPGFGTEY